MVASTRSSSKRLLSYVKREDMVPRKRARKSTSKSIFPLLSLPIEIRALILQELLLLPEPIFFTSKSIRHGTVAQWREYFASLPPQRLFPDILYTCRQLYEEASKILYTNTIGCEVGGSRTLDTSPNDPLVILGPNWGDTVSKLPSAIVRRMSRISIRMHLQYQGWDENLLTVEEEVRDLSKGIRKDAPRWTDISIELLHSKPLEKRSPDDLEAADAILQPFIYLRNRPKVSIQGASRTMTEKLTQLITSDTPCVDLDFMLDAVQEHIEERIPENGDIDSPDNPTQSWMSEKIWDLYLNRLTNARDNDNIEEFYKVRSTIMLLVSCFAIGEQEKVYKHDPTHRKPDNWLQVRCGPKDSIEDVSTIAASIAPQTSMI
jgi:hypothetical protein